jgi:hypothetical protein
MPLPCYGLFGSATIRREMRRRAGIEPVIGHMTDDGHLERSHLAGPEGDAVKAIPCAAGHNMRLLARWLTLLFAVLIAIICGHAVKNCRTLRQPYPRRRLEYEIFTSDEL